MRLAKSFRKGCSGQSWDGGEKAEEGEGTGLKMVEVVVDDLGGMPGETVIDLHLAGAGFEHVAGEKVIYALFEQHKLCRHEIDGYG